MTETKGKRQKQKTKQKHSFVCGEGLYARLTRESLSIKRMRQDYFPIQGHPCASLERCRILLDFSKVNEKHSENVTGNDQRQKTILGSK